MPLILEKINKAGTRLVVWKVTESIEEVKSKLSLRAELYDEFDRLAHDKRRTEWIGRRFLFDHLGIDKPHYLENGKPVLETGYITISHCNDLVAVLLAPYPIGMDLQKPEPIIERIKERFCNEGELMALSEHPNPLDYLTKIWSAKEAVFKVFGENVPFAEGMRIFESKEDGILRCRLQTEDLRADIELQVERIQDYLLVYNRAFSMQRMA